MVYARVHFIGDALQKWSKFGNTFNVICYKCWAGGNNPLADAKLISRFWSWDFWRIEFKMHKNSFTEYPKMICMFETQFTNAILNSDEASVIFFLLTYHGCRTIINLNNDDIIRFSYFIFVPAILSNAKRNRLVGVNDWLLDQCFAYNSAQTFAQVKCECRLNATDFEHKHLNEKNGRKMNCSAYNNCAYNEERHFQQASHSC